MIHETLLYLWRDNSILDEVQRQSTIMELQGFLHPGEQRLFEHIIDIAVEFHRINAFVKRVLAPKMNNTNPAGGDAATNGVYTRAFCRGVDAVLTDYCQDIVDLEATFLRNPQLPLTFILSVLQKYRQPFTSLYKLVEQVVAGQLYGCRLSAGLHEYSTSGVDAIVTMANRILHSLNRVFYQHLANWIVYGDLHDSYEEFFVRDEHCADEQFVYLDSNTAEDCPDFRAITGGVFDYCRSVEEEFVKRPPPVRKFTVNWHLVPNFITKSMTETILFMGRIVWIVRNEPTGRRGTAPQQQQMFKSIPRHDLWAGKDLEYYRKIGDMQTQYFSTVQFQSTIEECRKTLTKSLWTLMVVEGRFIEHLHQIRDYYCLGKGELFQEFLNSVVMPAFYTRKYAFNAQFHEIVQHIYGVGAAADSARFHLSVTNPSSEGHQHSEDYTQKKFLQFSLPQFHLSFSVKWPLHIVFYPHTIDLYNRIFNYLLRVKVTQMNLHTLWRLHSKQNVDKRVWTLRQQLHFLVNNLQYYLHVDVIEAQFSILLKAVNSANEFEDIVKVHHEFVTNLLAKMFLLDTDKNDQQLNCGAQLVPEVTTETPQNTTNSEHLSRVYNVIMRLLELCDHFCLIATTWEPHLTEPDLFQLEEFVKRTKITIESLLFIFNGLHERTNGEHLLQILYQLDFNRYFSRTTVDFNLTTGVGGGGGDDVNQLS